MKKYSVWQPRSTFGQVISSLFDRFVRHDIARDSAALTYYLLFAIFPLLIFISTMVGIFGLNLESTMAFLDDVVPAAVAEIAENYLIYVSTHPSRNLMIFSLIFSIWFPMRATSCLTHSLRKAYGRLMPQSRGKMHLSHFLFSLLLIVTISLSLLLILVGRRLLEFVGRFVVISPLFITLWSSLRFVVLALLMVIMLAILYMLAQETRCPLSYVLPGILGSLCAWMLLSGAFSYYVEHRAHYAELYGSIATIVVVLLWLYMSAMVLLCGAEFNAILLQHRGVLPDLSPEEER